MAIIGGIIAGVGAIAGSALSSSASQSNTNATNAMNANLNKENMDWQTNMSNTAMQRRVTDLKAAGLNPFLAVDQGGASTPGYSPIPMQANTQGPSALATGIGQAAQIASQVKLTSAQAANAEAQANKTNAESDALIPAQQQALMASAQQSYSQAKSTAAGMSLIRSQVSETDTRASLEETQNALKGIDMQTAMGMQKALISAANSDAQAKALGLPEMQNMNAVQRSNMGQILAVLNSILKPASSAVGIASKAYDMGR